jgi:hypothetical protein
MNEIDEENNLMWEEIRKMSEIIPEPGVSTDDRQSFLTEGGKNRPAEGKHSPPKNLITSKGYKGPEIKSLMPKYVQDKIKYSE